MQITGGNVRGKNAEIGPSGSITTLGEYFTSDRVRAVQIIDRESKVNFWDAAGNVGIGDMLAGSTGEIVGAVLTQPREKMTVAISLWWDKAIVGIASHDEFRLLAGAAAANGGVEPSRTQSIEAGPDAPKPAEESYELGFLDAVPEQQLDEIENRRPY